MRKVYMGYFFKCRKKHKTQISDVIVFYCDGWADAWDMNVNDCESMKLICIKL